MTLSELLLGLGEDKDMSYHSQFGEDAWIEKYLNFPVGTFCEVGAFDGVNGSNTKHFEELGWKGICIEPVPGNAAKCMENRSAVTWCCAVGNASYKPFYLGSDQGAGGLECSGPKVFPVCVCPLSSLVLASGFKQIDLLSIDTEGTELEVWNTRGPLEPKIVIMEYLTWGKPPRDLDIYRVMAADGYTQVHRTEANLIFTK